MYVCINQDQKAESKKNKDQTDEHGLTKKNKRGQIRFCPMAVSAHTSSLSYDVFISFRGEDTRL
ncbi:hypothetical protein A2U01_0082093, partial [Trifolium medium]|nr:hypothetical protein [Trifolium medium]